MNVENKLARLMRDTGPARFFVPFGLILIIFGCIMLGFNTDNFEQTTGKITSVTDVTTDKDQKQYDIGIVYTVDGKEYENVFNNLSGNYSVGDNIDVWYNPEDPNSITNSKNGKLIALAMIGVGALGLVFGVLKTVKAFRNSKAMDQAVGGRSGDFAGFKEAPGVTEYYFRWDGNSLKPGYLIEDAGRNVLFEGKMLKQALVGARVFEFTDHTTGTVKQHEVGHTVTQTYNNEFFSAKSWFKVDGANVWDVLHGGGFRLVTSLLSKFPHIVYNLSRGGEAVAVIETTSMYVHEDDEAKHSVVVPTGHRFYRFWTNSQDFDSLFLTMFALSETEQAVVE